LVPLLYRSPGFVSLGPKNNNIELVKRKERKEKKVAGKPQVPRINTMIRGTMLKNVING